MSDPINRKAFLDRLTFSLKLSIHSNKGIENASLLERAVRTYNKYKKMETGDEMTDTHKVDLEKLIRRINLILKIDDDGRPVDISKRESQVHAVRYNANPILFSSDPYQAIESGINVDLLTGIPISFFFKDSPLISLTWNYIRATYFISQYIKTKGLTTVDNQHLARTGDSLTLSEAAEINLIDVLREIQRIKAGMGNVDKLLSGDSYLRNKLFNPKAVNKETIAEASSEMKRLFDKQNPEKSSIFHEMIDRVTSRIEDVQNSDGNMFQNMMAVAQDITREMSGKVQGQGSFEEIIGTVKAVFQESVEQHKEEADSMPPELKSLVDKFTTGDLNEEITEDKLRETLNATSQFHGMTADVIDQTIASAREPDGTLNDAAIGDMLKKFNV
jgi:hypothetical protein